MPDFLTPSILGPAAIVAALLVALGALYAHGSPRVRRIVGYALGALSLLVTGALAALAVLRSRGDPSTAAEDARRREADAGRAADAKRDAAVREAAQRRDAEKERDAVDRANEIIDE